MLVLAGWVWIVSAIPWIWSGHTKLGAFSLLIGLLFLFVQNVREEL